MSKIIKFTVADKEKHALAVQIRTKVFVEEQNVDIDLEIENEEESIHFLLYYRRRPVATARYRTTDKGVKLERFAMLKEYRGKGLGNDLLRFVLNEARKKGKHIYLNSQARVTGYYEKFGFKRKGEPFYEAGIKHFLMEYRPDNNLDKALEKAVCRR